MEIEIERGDEGWDTEKETEKEAQFLRGQEKDSPLCVTIKRER